MFSEVCESHVIADLAVCWGLVELEIAAVYDGADGRRNRQAYGIRDAVRDSQTLELKIPDLKRITWPYGVELSLVQQASFREPSLGKSKS